MELPSWGALIKLERIRLLLSQNELAKRAGVAVSTVSRIEGGINSKGRARVAPSAATMEKIEQALDRERDKESARA